MEAVMYGQVPGEVQEALTAMVRMPARAGVSQPASLPWVPVLTKHGIIQDGHAWLAGPRAVIVSPELYCHWEQALHEVAPHYMSALSESIPLLKQWLLDHVHADEAVRLWIGLAGWVLDIGAGRVLRTAHWYGQEPETFWIWIYDKPNPELISFGVRIQYGPGKRTAFGEVWADFIRKAPSLPINLAPTEVEAIAAIAGSRPVPPERMDLRRARYFGLVRRGAHGEDEAAIPYLCPPDVSDLEAVFSAVAEQVMDASLLRMDLGDNIPHEDHGSKEPIYRHAFSRLLMQHILAELIGSGVLPRPAAPQQARWGAWIAEAGIVDSFFTLPFTGGNE